MAEEYYLLEGDILGKSAADRGGKLIDWRTDFENRGLNINTVHVGLITSPGSFGPLSLPPLAQITEALLGTGVTTHSANSKYAYLMDHVWVARPINLNQSEIDRWVDFALSKVGYKYGVGKIVLHALGLENLIFKRNTAICSWLLSMGLKEIGYDFGVKARAADPGDIERFVRENIHTKYVWVKPPPWLLGAESLEIATSPASL